MNNLLLLTLCAIEIVLAVLNISRHTDTKGFRCTRLIANGAEMLVFLVSLISPEVNLGLRFTALFVLLIVRLICALFCFLVKLKSEPKKKRVFSKIFSAVLSCLLFLAALVPSFVFANYNGLPTSGEYEVGFTKAILVDESRTEQFETDGSFREVPVYFYYPETDGTETFPLVVFSHGAFGYYESNSSTYMELASNGYVVVSTEHPYHSLFTTDTNGNTIIVDTTFISDVVGIDSFSAEEEFEKSSQWVKLRTDDVNFVLDSIEKACDCGNLDASWNCDDNDEILRALAMCDCSSIGLMGHSLGGATAVTLGRTRDDIDAVIDFDGTMLGEVTGVENGVAIVNEEPYTVPLLSFNSEKHKTKVDNCRADGTTYANVTVIDNAEESFETAFIGAEHMNFTDLPMFSPMLGKMLGIGTADPQECVEKMNEITLEFFDCYLKNDGDFSVEESYDFS